MHSSPINHINFTNNLYKQLYSISLLLFIQVIKHCFACELGNEMGKSIDHFYGYPYIIYNHAIKQKILIKIFNSHFCDNHFISI